MAVGTSPQDTFNVLIVDDDEEFAGLVAQFLVAEGEFAVAMRHDGQSGVEAAVGEQFDVTVLDVGLPGLDGFEALKQIRQQVDTPVVMLTARGDEIDRIQGLEIGADDYIPKPCNLRELVARIRAIIRRLDRPRVGGPADDQVVVGDLKIEPGAQSVFINGVLIPLTGAEYLVLEALVRFAGQIIDKDSIARRALGRSVTPYDRSVDVHIGNLRKKVGPLADGRQRIKTVRGRGYLYVTSS